MRAITQMQMVQGNHLSTFDLYTMSMFFGGACNAFYAMFIAFFVVYRDFMELRMSVSTSGETVWRMLSYSDGSPVTACCSMWLSEG